MGRAPFGAVSDVRSSTSASRLFVVANVITVATIESCRASNVWLGTRGDPELMKPRPTALLYGIVRRLVVTKQGNNAQAFYIFTRLLGCSNLELNQEPCQSQRRRTLVLCWVRVRIQVSVEICMGCSG